MNRNKKKGPGIGVSYFGSGFVGREWVEEGCEVSVEAKD
jgi:hypothetical protein